MKKTPILENENLRLESLRSYQILDTPSEKEYEDITFLASFICGTPISAITFIDKERQWFKAKVGVPFSESPRDTSFCAHAILTEDLTIVPDATKDERFLGNPFVVSDPKIRFYAGAPLITSDNFALGTLCVVDFVSHELTEEQKKALKALSVVIVRQLELRRALIQQKETEESLLKAKEELDKRVVERTAELKSAVNQLELELVERKRTQEKLTNRVDDLATLHDIDITVSSSFDLRATLHLFLEKAQNRLQADAVDILLFTPETSMLEFYAGRGFYKNGLKGTTLRWEEHILNKVMVDLKMLFLPDVTEIKRKFAYSPMITSEKFVSYVGIPLVAKGQLKGVFEIFHRFPFQLNSEWKSFVETLASQAAFAIDNSLLFEGLQNSNDQLVLTYDTTLEGWSRALDLRDKETEGHTQRVTEMTVKLAREFGFTNEDILHIKRGSLLHDIGKMGVPDNILLKPGVLTEEEWVAMKKHPVNAYELLSPIPFLRPALEIPYCHHEKWDGTGYPRGLKGEMIPLSARLFAIVDVWDALLSDRSYRKGWRVDKVREHLRSESGTHFDPKIVGVFLKMDW